MRPMREHEPVSPPQLEGLPVQMKETVTLRCTPEQLFASFARAEDWQQWLDLNVEWTSPEPFGPGTTRTVRSGPLVADETFTEWEPGSQMSFYFSRSSVPLFRQFAESYTVRPRPEGCTLTWQVGIRPTLLGRLIAPLVIMKLRSGLRRGASTLEALARGDRVA